MGRRVRLRASSPDRNPAGDDSATLRDARRAFNARTTERFAALGSGVAVHLETDSHGRFEQGGSSRSQHMKTAVCMKHITLRRRQNLEHFG